MEYTKKYKAYVLIDPTTNIPRYVGITLNSLRLRLSGHLSDVYNRPDLNSHKTNWFKKLLKGGKMPIIEQIAEFDTEEEMKLFEIDYISKYRDKYKLINLTSGGDHLGFRAHTRESILKKKTTRAVDLYNILGEKIAEYLIMEDISRELNLGEKSCSHITLCCKGTRKHAYGYIWRYKGDPLGDISNINPKSLFFNKLVLYDLDDNRIAEYTSYKEASEAIGDKSKGGNIASVVSGKLKSCKGYYFQVEPIYCYFDQNLFDKIYLKLWSSDPYTIKNTGKTVQLLDSDKNIIATFNSISSAAERVAGNSGSSARLHIKDCCLDPTKTYKGFYWKLV